TLESKMKKILFLFYMLSFGVTWSSTVWALACYDEQSGGRFGSENGHGGITVFQIDPSASVPNGASDGQVVWRGPSKTVTISCYKDANNYPGLMNHREQVHFWPGMTGNPSITHIPGIKVGFRFKGRDYYGEKVPIPGFEVEGCSHSVSYDYCEKSTIKTKTFTYQPIIVTGPGDFSGYRSSINIFQVDGEFGYNGRFRNYRTIIDSFNNIKPTECLVELDVQGDNVDFGTISAGVSFSEVSKPLTIQVKNITYSSECPSVKLRGYFKTNTVNNNRYITVVDEENKEIKSLGIELYTSDGSQIKINEPIGDGFTIKKMGYDRYFARLVSVGAGEIKKGKFSGVAVYTVSYL
ncbi:fimbrial protein, partial [Vibrio azureus]